MPTAVSCKWSELIKESDLFVINPHLGNRAKYAYVHEIRAFKIQGTKNDGGTLLGDHVLTCQIKHTPNECDYSHVDINIAHTFTENGETKTLVYDHDDWTQKRGPLRSKNRFLKELRRKYRTDLISLIKHSL